MALAATVVPNAEPHRYVIVCSSTVGAVVFGVAATRARVLPGWATWTVLAVLFVLVMVFVG
jgi:hypothetical protein